ncbi:MAG TPA: hypothetical protein VLW55_20530 [Burkholderiaceae bacterium]|nr:hypothetical protein [Burkholderiaceae bacterium]
MKRLSACFVATTAALLAAGCGSDNNSTPQGPTPTVTLTSANVDAAARASANAAVSSASVANVNPASAGASAAASPRARSVQQLLLNLTRQVVIDRATVKAAPGGSAIPRAQALITRTDPCDSGSVTSVLDDRDNSNSVSSGDLLTVTFNQCQSGTALVDGSVSATYSVVQAQPGFASATATVTYTQLHASSTDGDFSINGSFNYSLSYNGSVYTTQLSIGVNDLTASVNGAAYSDTVTLHAGYTVTATRDPNALPPGSATPGLGTLTVNGAISATSIGGTILINTPMTIKQYDIDPYPREGQVQVHGLNNGLLVLTVLSTSTVRVQLDADADGNFEVDKNVAWTTLI